MTPFLLMLGVFVLLHLPVLRRWPGGPRPADKAAGALGLVLVLTGVLHFMQTARFAAMIPPFLAAPDLLVHVSGVAELLVAAGLLLPRTRRVAGWGGVALFLAIWPANIYVAISGNAPEGFSQSAAYHWIRVPFQLLYVGWAAWCALGHVPGLGFRRYMMARLYDRVTARHEAWTAPHRAALLEDVSGTVLELGPGTGANFRHLPPGVRWIGVEPNVHMHPPLLARAAEHGIAAEVRTVGAEGMEVEAGSIDVVISTLVLCSVPDPRGVVDDVRRVLKPGGRFVFLEHVAAPRGTGLRRFQALLRPVWQFWADGCCPDRELAEVVEAAGFERVEIRRMRAPKEAVPAFVAPHVAGTAFKSS